MATKALPDPQGFKRINIIQGESRVSGDAAVVLSTVLGSCIAACLYDPDRRIGGMNHFLLAEPGGGETDVASMQRYGVFAMELLINALLAKGATRNRLRARLYGGASMHKSLRDIGGSNSRFARTFLRDEGIALVAEDVGGISARRIEFRPAMGLARCKTITDRVPERVIKPVAPPPPSSSGDVEFF